MERPPNDRQTSGIGETLGERELLVFRSERDGMMRSKHHVPPMNAGDRRHDQPGHHTVRQHDERRNSPAVILRVAPPRNARERINGETTATKSRI